MNSSELEQNQQENLQATPPKQEKFTILNQYVWGEFYHTATNTHRQTIRETRFRPALPSRHAGTAVILNFPGGTLIKGERDG